MNIVCLTHYYIEENRAGGELMLHGLLKALAGDGHNVTALITNTAKLNTVIDGVNVVYGVDRGRVLDTYDYDMVFTQFENTPIAIEHAHKHGKQVVVVAHNDMTLTQTYIASLRHNDMVVYNTDWIRDKLQTPCRSVVVHPQIEVGECQNKGQYITLVNMFKEKGTNVFYELARRLPQYKFMGVKGGYYKKNQLILHQENIIFIDNTPDMCADVYAKTKIVLMPSSYESYGMVASEAIACGIPVMCTPLAGLKENLGECGIFLDDKKIDLWVTKIKELMGDKKAYKAQSDLCRQYSQTKDQQGEINNFLESVKLLKGHR